MKIYDHYVNLKNLQIKESTYCRKIGSVINNILSFQKAISPNKCTSAGKSKIIKKLKWDNTLIYNVNTNLQNNSLGWLAIILFEK